MKDVLVPIDQAGRIVLPKNVRDELAIRPGDTLKLGVSGSTVTLTPNRAKSGLVRKGKALIFSTAGGEVLTNEMVDSILERGREERHSRILSGFEKK